MAKILHSLLFLLLLPGVFSCGTQRRMSQRSVADSVWTFSQTHPDGFTVNLSSMTEPTEGISVAYAATQSSHGRQALDAVVSHATAHEGFVGGWLDPSDSLFYFDSVRIFPEDSLEAAVKFGKSNLQKAVFKLSTGEEILLKEDDEFVSPTNLIIMYDPEIGKGPLLEAVKSYGAEILYEYSIISGIAIKVPGNILQAITFFADVKGVTAVERDHIYHLPTPVKPRLEVR